MYWIRQRKKKCKKTTKFMHTKRFNTLFYKNGFNPVLGSIPRLPTTFQATKMKIITLFLFAKIAKNSHKLKKIVNCIISKFFGRLKLHKKGSIKKLSQLWDKFSSNTHFLCQSLLCTNAVLENTLQNRDNFFK